MTGPTHDLPGEQLAELKHLSDSQGPDGSSHCSPRRIQYCVVISVRPRFLRWTRAHAYPSSSNAMLCCCPHAICTIFLSSKPLTGTATIRERPNFRRHPDQRKFSLGSLSMSNPVRFPVAMCSPVRPLPSCPFSPLPDAYTVKAMPVSHRFKHCRKTVITCSFRAR
jgi:hypothetical protein